MRAQREKERKEVSETRETIRRRRSNVCKSWMGDVYGKSSGFLRWPRIKKR